MGVFDKNIVCEYCKKEMVASYRSKRFCSDKCRIYFRRKNVKLNVPKTKKLDVHKSVQKVTNIQKNDIDVLVQKELTMGELFKLMRKGKM